MAWPPTNCAFWLSPAYTAHMYQDTQFTASPSAHSTTDGHTVGEMFEPISGLELAASTTSNAPTLQSDATRLNSLLFTGGNRNLKCINSKGAFRFIHYDQDATIVFRIKMVTALASGLEMIAELGNSASSGSNAYGASIYRNASENIVLSVAKGTTGTLAITLTGPVINDTDWHYVVIRIARGSNATSITVDGGTPVTGTLHATLPAAAGDSLYDMQFGLSGLSGAAGSFYLDNFAIIEGALASEDLTSWLALNEARTATSQAIPTASGSSLDPDDVPFLHAWHRMTDATLLRQEDGTTAVTTADDPVGLVINQKPARISSDWQRNLNQTTEAKCPLWKTNQVNGLGAPLWAGQAHAIDETDFDGENTLQIPSWPIGSFTWIGVYKCTERPFGGHVLARTAAEYLVQTSSLYQSGARGDVAVHAGGSFSQTTTMAPDPEGVLIVAVRQDGDTMQSAMLNTWVDAETGAGRFGMSHMGRTFKPEESGTTWDFFGSVYESVLYSAWLDNATITKLIRPLVERYGVEGVAGLGSGGQRSGGIGIGMGIGI